MINAIFYQSLSRPSIAIHWSQKRNFDWEKYNGGKSIWIVCWTAHVWGNETNETADCVCYAFLCVLFIVVILRGAEYQHGEYFCGTRFE